MNTLQRYVEKDLDHPKGKILLRKIITSEEYTIDFTK